MNETIGCNIRNIVTGWVNGIIECNCIRNTVTDERNELIMSAIEQVPCIAQPPASVRTNSHMLSHICHVSWYYYTSSCFDINEFIDMLKVIDCSPSMLCKSPAKIWLFPWKPIRIQLNTTWPRATIQAAGAVPRDPTVCYSDGYRLLKTSGPGVSPENVFSRRPANQEVNLTNQPLREQYQPTWQQDQPIKVERFPEINQGNWRWCLHGVCLPYRGPRTDCTQNTVLELLLLAHYILSCTTAAPYSSPFYHILQRTRAYRSARNIECHLLHILRVDEVMIPLCEQPSAVAHHWLANTVQ